MDMNNVGLYILLCVKVFLFVKAQVTFDPDLEEDVQLHEVTNLQRNISVTTVQCYTESPSFQVQYVTPDDHKAVYIIEINRQNVSHGFPVSIADGTCNQTQSQYRVFLGTIRFIVDPVLVGETFRMKAILDANEENCTFSRTTYTFPAPFNLTRSSVSAVIHFNFTWTCHVTSDYPIIEWFQNSRLLGQIGISHNRSCTTYGMNDSYIYNCQYSTLTYTLEIPGSILTAELQGSTWRCNDVTNQVHGSKFVELDIVYPPKVSLYLQNTSENSENITIRCTSTGKPNNATIVVLQQRIGSTLIRNITNYAESSPGNITLTIPRVSYQDMGTYTCLASNGIPDRYHQKIQSDTAYLDVNTSAKFQLRQYTVRSDIGTQAVVRIPFYRNPPANESDIAWTRNTGSIAETLGTSVNFSFSLGVADVQQKLHGIDVTLKGQSAVMTITSFQSNYEGNYSLRIRGPPRDSEVVAIIILRSAPVAKAPSALNSGLVGGAAGGGGIAVLVVIIVIIVVVKRRRHQGGKGNEHNSRETLAGSPRQKGDDEDGDGLKDNPLYGGNPGAANVVQGASDAPENPSVYPKVIKPKKKNPAKVNDDPPPIYAEVDKSSKKNAKGKQKKQNTKDKAGGEQYKNMDGFKQTGSTDKKKAKENEQRGYKNKDGLFYMDVKFDQPPTSGRPTIRKEEPTGYAMIQFEEPIEKPTSTNARGAEGRQ